MKRKKGEERENEKKRERGGPEGNSCVLRCEEEDGQVRLGLVREEEGRNVLVRKMQSSRVSSKTIPYTQQQNHPLYSTAKHPLYSTRALYSK